MRSFSRRRFLAGGMALTGAMTMPAFALQKHGDGFFDLRAKRVSKAILPGLDAASDLWLFDGRTPGPEIRVRRGETVRVRFRNELDVPTLVHWHGIRIEHAMDGVSGFSQEPVLPGETFDYVFTVPDAGTFWYHAHNRSWEQVARGLYGPLIVEDGTRLAESFDDVTLVLDDWRVAQDGSFDGESLGFLGDWSHAGRLGNLVTVNGRYQPRIALTAGKPVRLRLINASNARVFNIRPVDMNAELIGYDGFVFDRPRDTGDAVEAFGPAQRMDLWLSPQETGELVLRDVGDIAIGTGSLEAPPLAIFEVREGSGAATPIQARLTPNAIAEPDLATALAAELVMSGGAMGRLDGISFDGRRMSPREAINNGQFWVFNGVANLPNDPLFSASAGRTVRLRLINETGWPHAMHLHGYHFRVLSRNGRELEHQDWRDTVMMDGGDTVEIAFVADNPGRWMLHCHMLEHAAAGMVTWFEVA